MNTLHRFLYCLKRAWKEFTCAHQNYIKRYHYKGGELIVCSRCHRATLEPDEEWDIW